MSDKATSDKATSGKATTDKATTDKATTDKATTDKATSAERGPSGGTEQRQADGLVLFGLTGDLGEKKLFPAIADLAAAGLLQGPVIGVGRSEHSDDELWAMFIDAVGADAEALRDTLDLHYLAGDSQDPQIYSQLADRLKDSTCPVIYAALPPDLFAGVASGISKSKFGDSARLVVEKPFGSNAATARSLYDDITAELPPERLFAVDHFLAKSAVENLLTFRHVNPMISASLCSTVVDRIEITMAEAFGVDGRGGFYESVGAIKDVVQNHLLQTVAVLLMEAPEDDTTEAYDRARAELLNAIAPIDPAEAVIGQFDGYRDVEDVADDSTTETFFAGRIRVDNERWSGVEIVLRTGKELDDSYTEAIIEFAHRGPDVSEHRGFPNRLRFALKPEATIAIEVGVLDPDGHDVVPTVLWACGPSGHGELSDYATMLAGALAGEHRHFAQIADIEAAWRIVDRVLEHEEAPDTYRPGSMGPDAADEIVSTGRWIDGPLLRTDP